MLLLGSNPFSALLDPFVHGLTWVLIQLTHVTHNVGWSLVLLAALIKIVLWPLSDRQYKSMQQMKRVQPKIQALQAKFKGDPQKLQQETMAFYKSEGVNPLAGCWPLVLQLPILFSVYWAITTQSDLFETTHWLWIGSPIAQSFPIVFAQNLKDSDHFLLVVYAISMFFSVRLSTPSMDPTMQQQQRIMSYIYPVMFGVIGQRWPSALIIYWLMFNLFTMAQQGYLMRKYAAASGPVDAVSIDNVAKRPRKPASLKSKGGLRR